MFAIFQSKTNPVSQVLAPVPALPEKKHLHVKKIIYVSHPILKALGLMLLFGAVTALSSYSLLNVVIATEMTRLIFLCGIALILQKNCDTDSCKSSIVKEFLEA